MTDDLHAAREAWANEQRDASDLELAYVAALEATLAERDEEMARLRGRLAQRDEMLAKVRRYCDLQVANLSAVDNAPHGWPWVPISEVLAIIDGEESADG